MRTEMVHSPMVNHQSGPRHTVNVLYDAESGDFFLEVRDLFEKKEIVVKMKPDAIREFLVGAINSVNFVEFRNHQEFLN